MYRHKIWVVLSAVLIIFLITDCESPEDVIPPFNQKIIIDSLEVPEDNYNTTYSFPPTQYNQVSIYDILYFKADLKIDYPIQHIIDNFDLNMTVQITLDNELIIQFEKGELEEGEQTYSKEISTLVQNLSNEQYLVLKCISDVDSEFGLSLVTLTIYGGYFDEGF